MRGLVKFELGDNKYSLMAGERALPSALQIARWTCAVREMETQRREKFKIH